MKRELDYFYANKMNDMTKQIASNKIYNSIIIVLLLIAIAIRSGANFNWLLPSENPLYTIADVHHAFPEAVTLDQNKDKSFSVLNSAEEEVGLVLISDELDAKHQGYGGEVPLLIALDLNKVIQGTYLLPNNETGEFLDHIDDVKLLNTWNGLTMDTTILSKQVDGVTGATKSSEAIIYTFDKTVRQYHQVAYQAHGISFVRILQVILFVMLLFVSLSMVLKKRFRRWYIYYIGLLVLIMGLWLKKMLSLELLHTWLSSGLSWQSNWELIVILILAIVMGLMGHKKYYCNYLCPMGALQILVSKVSPFKKRSFAIKISTLTLRTIYLSFIWASIILGLAMPLGVMEPFMAFSFNIATWSMLAVGGLIILLSFFFNRPWCQLCPTGCLLDSVPSLKSRH